MRTSAITLAVGLVLSGSALAHPYAKTEYSLRTAVRASGDAVQVVAVLEVPYNVVLRGVVALGGGMKVGQEEVDRYNQGRWAELARAITVSVDGTAVPIERWAPVATPLNGKATEGFFVYLVGTEVSVAGKPRPVVEVDVEGFRDLAVPLYLSASAEVGDGWTVVEDSSSARLADQPEASGAWTLDPALRDQRVVFARRH